MWIKYAKNPENDFSSVQMCAYKLSKLLPDLNQKIIYSNDHCACYVPDEQKINIPSFYKIKNWYLRGCYDDYQRYHIRNLGIFNETILIFHVLLHEYRHSIQPKSMFNNYEWQYMSAKTLDDIRNIPCEKDADEYAFNFIKEHWDFLVS